MTISSLVIDSVASDTDTGALDDLALFEEDAETETATSSAPLAVPFAIDSEDRANWYLRKLANLAAERERITDNSRAMLAAVKHDEETLRQRFGPQLEQWAKDELVRRKSKTKKLTLFQGTISFKRVVASVSVPDTEAALVHARTFYPELIETVPRLNTTEYGKIARQIMDTETLDEATGEMVPGQLLPGCEVKPERESMSIKFVALSDGTAGGEEGQ